MAEPLFATQRRKIYEAYKAANQPFVASTKPYKSTVAFGFNVTNELTAASVNWLVAPAGQVLTWFGYKLNDPVPTGVANVGAYRSALEDDTNLSKARTTNGAEDFVIEGMSASCRGARVLMGQLSTIFPTGITDPTVQSALEGTVPIYDPGALYVAPQVFSPFNLENGLFRFLQPLIAVEFEWDRTRIVKMGTLDQIPEGAANSYLRATGEPSTNDRYRIPEGYIWRREGEPDCEFIVRGSLVEPLAVPVLNVSTPTSATTAVVSATGPVWLDVVLRLHGLSFKLPTRN